MRKDYERICSTYTKNLFLMDDGNSDKKAKGTKKCVIKRMIIKDCKLLIELHHILMEKVLRKYVKQRC